MLTGGSSGFDASHGRLDAQLALLGERGLTSVSPIQRSIGTQFGSSKNLENFLVGSTTVPTFEVGVGNTEHSRRSIPVRAAPSSSPPRVHQWHELPSSDVGEQRRKRNATATITIVGRTDHRIGSQKTPIGRTKFPATTLNGWCRESLYFAETVCTFYARRSICRLKLGDRNAFFLPIFPRY